MIYFIRNITSKAIKIGRSNNGGESRLSSLSTGSTSDLEVIFNWDAPDAMEADLHQRFAYCRIPSTNSKKEWFYSDPCLEGFIEGLQFASKFTIKIPKNNTNSFVRNKIDLNLTEAEQKEVDEFWKSFPTVNENNPG